MYKNDTHTEYHEKKRAERRRFTEKRNVSDTNECENCGRKFRVGFDRMRRFCSITCMENAKHKKARK